MEKEIRSNLKFYDREVLRLLLKNSGYMTANQIAETLHMSWNTAQKHLKRLEELGLVEASGDRARYVWKAWKQKKKLYA
ncbi:MAG: winged helix-turn-helix domain-containing protein [Candidatus Micrarchaeaceae archaeon]